MNTRSLVVDTDLKGLNDDAFALHYLIANGRRPDLVTSVFGNTTAGHSACDARFLIDEGGIPDVPVVSGADHPLTWDRRKRDGLRAVVDTLRSTTYLAGLSPAGHVWSRPFTSENDGSVQRADNGGDAASAITRHLSAKRNCDVLALGPLTNIASAVRHIPEEALRTHRLVFSGGGLAMGNVTSHTEFNAFADPEAASEALSAGWEQALVIPLDVTTSVQFGAGEVARIAAGGSIFGGQLADSRRSLHREKPHIREFMWDAVAAVILSVPELLDDSTTCQVNVEVEGKNPGRIRLHKGESAKRIRIATSARSGNVMEEFISAF